MDHIIHLKVEVLNIEAVYGMQFISFKQIGCAVSPCLPVPDIPDGLRAHSILSSKQNTIANFFAKQIWSRNRIGCQIIQSIYISGLGNCENESVSSTALCF